MNLDFIKPGENQLEIEFLGGILQCLERLPAEGQRRESESLAKGNTQSGRVLETAGRGDLFDQQLRSHQQVPGFLQADPPDLLGRRPSEVLL